MIDDEEEDFDKKIEIKRKSVAAKIADRLPELVDYLFDIASDTEEGARERLTAISTLLGYSLPKVGVEHVAPGETEEAPAHKNARAEVEALLKGLTAPPEDVIE